MTEHTDHSKELGSIAVAVGNIWVAVLAISVLSPDMVSGSEQQHLPIAAFTAWIWGMVATYAVFRLWVGLRRPPRHLALLPPAAVGVAVVWLVAAGVSVLTPEMVTGSDPTRMPLASILAPIAAAVLTLMTRAVTDLVGNILDEDTQDDTA